MVSLKDIKMARSVEWRMGVGAFVDGDQIIEKAVSVKLSSFDAVFTCYCEDANGGLIYNLAGDDVLTEDICIELEIIKED